MKRLLIILGVILLVLGVIGLVHPTFAYHQQEEVAKFGPVRATVDQQKTVEVPAAVSILLLVGGIGLVLLGPRMK
jgi:Flp pilus assembly protein CpaB